MTTKENMPHAIILAGGQGKRLRPLTATTPKPLLSVMGIPLLFRILKKLEQMGVKDAYVMTGYLAPQIENALLGYDGELKPICIREEGPMGSAGCLRLIADISRWEECIVVSGDAYFEFDLRQAVELRREKQAGSVICLSGVEHPEGLGILLCDRDGRIRDFTEKPTWSGVRGNLASTGIYVLGKEAIAHVVQNGDKGVLDFGKDVFPALMRQNVPIYGMLTEGFWCDVGTIEAYRECNLRLSGGNSVMGAGVKLASTAVLRRSVLLDGVQVGAGATVTDAVIGENVIIGEGATVGPGVVVGASAVIGDRSRIEKGVTLPAGTIVASRSVLCADLCMGRQGCFEEGMLILHPEDAYRCGKRAGRAFGACKKESCIGMMRPHKKGKGDFVKGFAEGVLESGADLMDFGWGFVSKASFAARCFDCTYTVFVKEENGEVVLFVFDEDGLYPDAEFERKFSDLVAELPPMQGEYGKTYLCKDVDERYCAALCAAAEHANLRGLGVSLCPGDSEVCRVLSVALGKLGAEITEKADIVFSLDETGRKANVAVCGMQVGHWQMLTVLASEQAGRNGIVFLPYCCPEYIKKTVHSAGGRTVYYTLYPANAGEKHIRGSLARQQPFLTDALFGVMRFAALLGRGGLRASYLAAVCGGVSVAEEDVAVSDSEKLRAVLAYNHDFDGEGILRRHRSGSVRLRACANGQIHLMAEAASDMDAMDLIEKTKKEILKKNV